MLVRCLALIVMAFGLAQCGDGASVNKLFASKGSKERVDYLMTKGRIQYDQGDFDSALEKISGVGVPLSRPPRSRPKYKVKKQAKPDIETRR